MRRVLLLSAMMVSFVVLGIAQQTVVQSPNGTEHWKKGDYQLIKWGCVQCTGTAEIHLVKLPSKVLTRTARTAPATIARTDYQEIGVIKASIPITPTTQFYSFNWKVGDYYGGSAPAGDGYKILVKIVTSSATVSDISDTDFVIGTPPTIDTFAINDGLAVTNQRRVTLNYTFSGFPAPGSYRVKCTPRPGTLGAWTPMPAGAYPTYDLPQEPGAYTIELWLANDLGNGLSRTDTIRYEVAPPPVTTKDYTVNAASIACQGFPDMNPLWYSCKCTSYSVINPSPNDCYCTSTGAVIVKTSAVIAVGTKVEYEFFGGRQLNEGWSFVSISYSDAGCKEPDCPACKGSAVLAMPQVGSQNILFKIRLWASGTAIVPYTCEFRINSLVIRGPADRPISEAFR
jgi:hypothetical protein